MQEVRHHEHLEGFLIQILEITIPKAGQLLIIILIEESIPDLQLDEVIVLLEIIPLVELVVIVLHLEVQIELVAIVLPLEEVVPHQVRHQRHQEVHLLQEVVQEVLEKNKKN